MHLYSLLHVFVSLGAIFVSFCLYANAALLSGQLERLNSNESIVLMLNNSTENKTHSVGENSVLTTSQRISLKEIRKLARLAGHEQPQSISDFDARLCYSQDCLEAAKEFYISMDFAKDPCTEWEKFACEWRTLSSKTALGQLSNLILKIDGQVKDILEDSFVEIQVMQSAHEYFRACLSWFQDISKIDHIKNFLAAFGNWPLLNGVDFEGDWSKILASIIKTAPENVTPFLFKFIATAVNNNKIVLQIDVGSTYLEMETEDIQELLQNLRKNSASSAQSEIEEIYEMQKCMKKLSVGKFNNSVKNNFTLISLEELQAKFLTRNPNSKLNILKLVQDVFKGTDVIISENTEVLVNLELLLKYLNLIQSVNQRDLVNILFVQLATILLGDTTNVLQRANLPFLENYKRLILREPLNQCIKETTEIFGHVLSEEYIRRFYTTGNEEMVKNLTDSLKRGFVSVVGSMKWLQTSSQRFIINKILKVEALIGFPKWILNGSNLTAFYSKLQLTGNATHDGFYLKYRQAALSWLNGKYWMMKLSDETMDGWNYKQSHGFVGDADVNYIADLNQIRIPAGAIQPPLFSYGFPGFMNFGGLGSIIARELAQIIDPEGIYMNNEGNVGIWLDEQSIRSYKEWSLHLQTEWDKEKNDFNMNDKIVSVIAYHITVKGYEDYLNNLKKEGKEELKLPGLAELQPETLLQIKYTNVLCEDPHFTQAMREGTIHSFSNRGLIPVSRTKYFMDLFECNKEKTYPAFDLI